MNLQRKIKYSKQNIIEKIYHKGVVAEFCGKIDLSWFYFIKQK